MSELTQPQSNDDLFDQACEWVVRLRAENIADTVLEQFADWVCNSPEHRQAFDQVAEMWGDLGVAARLPLEIPAAVKPPPQQSTTTSGSWLSNLFSLPVLGGFAAAAAVVAIMVTSPFAQNPDIYHTATGERLAVTLDDGSSIELNTNSTLEVLYRDNQRWLRLINGEVYFSVAKDKNRPFVVELDGAQAQAIGTEFNIYKTSADSAVITVTEGTVQVTDTDHPSRPKILEVGQAVNFDDRKGLKNLRSISTDTITLWRRGQVVFDNTPLKEVVSTLNRYSRTSIELTATKAAHIPISGTFSTERPLETAQAVAEVLTLTTIVTDDRFKIGPQSSTPKG